jgi:hypothetical protein
MAYFCFYHAGAASYLSEQEGAYWRRMMEAAENQIASPLGGRWPRSPERRHFRGEKCVDAIAFLSRREPSNWLNRLRSLQTHEQVISYVQAWPQFGPWIGFKIADMLEVVCGAPIAFSRNIPIIYKEPRACLDILSSETGVSPRTALDGLIAHVRCYSEPAAGRRCCDVQEAETVLCKYKGYRNGNYHVGKDTKEIRHALAGWGATADHLLQHLRRSCQAPISEPEMTITPEPIAEPQVIIEPQVTAPRRLAGPAGDVEAIVSALPQVRLTKTGPLLYGPGPVSFYVGAVKGASCTISLRAATTIPPPRL